MWYISPAFRGQLRVKDQAEKKVWRFGDYRLDEARRELSRGDEEIDVQPLGHRRLSVLFRQGPVVTGRAMGRPPDSRLKRSRSNRERPLGGR
jgi:DNA-binding response OmpR family regulator